MKSEFGKRPTADWMLASLHYLQRRWRAPPFQTFPPGPHPAVLHCPLNARAQGAEGPTAPAACQAPLAGQHEALSPAGGPALASQEPADPAPRSGQPAHGLPSFTAPVSAPPLPGREQPCHRDRVASPTAGTPRPGPQLPGTAGSPGAWGARLASVLRLRGWGGAGPGGQDPSLCPIPAPQVLPHPAVPAPPYPAPAPTGPPHVSPWPPCRKVSATRWHPSAGTSSSRFLCPQGAPSPHFPLVRHPHPDLQGRGVSPSPFPPGDGHPPPGPAARHLTPRQPQPHLKSGPVHRGRPPHTGSPHPSGSPRTSPQGAPLPAPHAAPGPAAEVTHR